MKKLFLLSLIFFNVVAKHTVFSPDGKYLVVTQNNIAKIFRVRSIEALLQSNLIFKEVYPDFKCDHGSEILSIGTDGKYLVTTGTDGSKMWKLESGRMLIKL